MRTKRRLPIGAVLVLAVVAGCASYGPQALPPGASLADVTRAMGPPSGEYALPEAGRRVEFARGPYGHHTWMLDFDAGGRLRGWTQVLGEKSFNDILAGMGRDEVLSRIGHPSETYRIAFQDRTLWSYRFEDLFCRWFQVGFDPAGRVVDTGYGPDPMCERETDPE
jgi:predicted small lipoprotein YifL